MSHVILQQPMLTPNKPRLVLLLYYCTARPMPKSKVQARVSLTAVKELRGEMETWWEGMIWVTLGKPSKPINGGS